MSHRAPLRLAAATASALLLATGTAWADPAQTVSSIAFDPASPVGDGTLVDITGTVVCGEAHGTFCTASGLAVTVGTIQIQQAQVAGNPVACADVGGGDFVTIATGAPDGSGQFTAAFDTTGLGGTTIGFRTHFPAAGGSHQPGQSASECADLVVLAAGDPLPDGTTSFTQGFYGSSPMGESVVALLIDEATCDEINVILGDLGEGLAIDCATAQGRAALAAFLTGEVGPGSDDGFLPSGFGPGQNLAAQKITLLLNLNLGVVLEAPAVPILSGYFLNVDVVQDWVNGVPGAYLDPVFANPELYDVCDDVDADMICDPGTLDLSPLGEAVADLDGAGTTVADILAAADALLASGDASIAVNGVILTRGDVTKILGLINESYDEGSPTGFVTAFDAD